MVFLLRRPFRYIIIGVLIIVVGYSLLTFTGILRANPTTVIFSSIQLSPEAVVEGEEATLTITIKNYADKIHGVEFKINTESPLVKFYYPNNKSLIAEPEKVGKNYTTIYPVKVDMPPGSEGTVKLTVKPKIISGFAEYTYRIQFILYADKAPVDSKFIYIKVKSAS